MGLLDILKQYSHPGAAAPTGDAFGHFDAVAQQANPEDLGKGIAAALRSDATPLCANDRKSLRAVKSDPESGCAQRNYPGAGACRASHRAHRPHPLPQRKHRRYRPSRSHANHSEAPRSTAIRRAVASIGNAVWV